MVVSARIACVSTPLARSSLDPPPCTERKGRIFRHRHRAWRPPVVIHQQFLIVAVPRQQMRVSQVLEQHDAAVAYPNLNSAWHVRFRSVRGDTIWDRRVVVIKEKTIATGRSGSLSRTRISHDATNRLYTACPVLPAPSVTFTAHASRSGTFR
jgi:hypothetical protein